MSKMFKIPSANSYHNVKDTRDEEEVGWENELMMEEMGDNSEGEGEGEGNEPEGDGVGRRKEHFESLEIVFEPFVL